MGCDPRGFTHGYAHAAGAGNQPAPDGTGAASSIQRVGEGGSDCREKATDTDGERESGEVAKLALEHRLVSERLGKSTILSRHVLEVDSLGDSIGSLDLYSADRAFAVTLSRGGKLVGHCR